MLQQNTVDKFVSENVASGEIHLLVSGALRGLAAWDNRTRTWYWPTTESWAKNQVTDTGEWEEALEDVESTTGSLQGGAYIKGLSVSILPKDSNVRKLESLKLCTRLKMDVQIGDSPTVSLDLNVKSRRLQGKYIFFEVEEKLLPADIASNIDIYFKYSGSSYRGYTCYTTGSQDVTMSLFPCLPPVESEEYDPILNNITQDTVSTVAQIVEPFEYKNVFLGTDAEHRYDGWYANWNSSEEYVQRLNGSGSLWESGVDPVVRASGGGALGIYQLLPTVFLEKGTTMALIPDYYFTSIANTSGRWLGTKNAEYRIYLGNKRLFTSKNLELCDDYIKANVQKGQFLVQQGSPFTFNTSGRDPLTADFSGSLEGTIVSGNVSGGISEGFLRGEIAGFVTDVDINHILSYYSSSVPVSGYSLQTLVNTPASIQGEGTRVLENSGKMVRSAFRNAQELSGEYEFADTPVSGQILDLKFNSVSGSILGWGKISGSGNVELTGSQETGNSSVIIKNVHLTGSGLQIENISSGSMYIIPAGTVFVSGTIGNTAENLTLSTFSGQLNLGNNFTQNIEYTPADDFGVELVNVETAEHSVVDFNSFVADSITFGDGFGGQAEVLVAEGKLNIASNNLLKASLLTEDQAEISGSGPSATGSLSGVDLFMSAGLDGNPVWEINNLRTQLDSREFLPEGVALLSGSFNSFTLEGTRTNLRLFQYRRMSGSLVPQSDTLQASRLLANLEAGVDFARTALARSGTVEISALSPSVISEAQMPGRIYEAVELASSYVVPGATRTEGDQEVPDTDPVWPDTGSILPPEFNFYSTDSDSRSRILSFITGSEIAIERLRTFMAGHQAGSLLRSLGQYAYVYLNSSAPNYLKAYLRDFSGSYLRLNGEDGTQGGGLLSGSFTKIWGRFGEGSIEQGRITDRTQAVSLSSTTHSIEIPFMHEMPLSGISGVIYGAFDYRGYFNGGYEGNMVGGTVEGSLSGLISGIADGHIEGSLVNLIGVSRGKFKGTVRTGSFTGAMKDIAIEGNNLTNNFLLSGTISSVENFALQGTAFGHVQTAVLPEQCTYSIEGFSENLQQSEISIPDQGRISGEFKVYPERVGETETIELDGTVSANTDYINLTYTHSLDTQELSARVYSGSQEITGVTWTTPTNSTVSLRVPVEVSSQTYPISGTVVLERGLDWKGTLGKKVQVKLTGNSIDENVIIGGTVSESLKFPSEGLILMPPVSVVDTDSQEVYLESSTVSGQFEVSGRVQMVTEENNPFSGKISPIFISQSVRGDFDVDITDSTYARICFEGKLQEVEGHVLSRGKVELESGARGNLVEGHDRPFFTLQGFSGSVFPIDTTDEAFRNMETTDMVIDRLTFTSGMALVGYSSGSFGVVKEQEYVKNTLSLPQIGDVVFTGEGGKARVVSSKIYCPELHGILTINDKGTVISVDSLG